MTLNERNYAGDHMVVGSLEVLGNINSAGITEIRRNVDLIQKQTEMAYRQQNEYWKELSSDGVITPLEKQQLLKEMRSITQSQAAIVLQARSVGMEGSQFVQDYLAVYNDLYSYLYTTLKLFDDMEMSTEIPDRATFNNYFTSYYYDESFVYIALSKGLLNSLNITVLSSLSDEGTEGELGLYKGNLYQYTDGEWKHVATGDYKGALTSLPTAQQDSFFLAADDFILVEALYVNDEPLYVNSYELGVNRLYRKGYIYYCQDGRWYEESDKTNYRYVAAFADVLNITGELPQVFQDALDDLQEQINELDFPTYKGLSNIDPLNPTEGDFYVYSGTTTATRRKSDIYRYENGDWVRLDPLESQNSTYYMQALQDILTLNNADNGYFAALFSQALFANNAFLYALSTKILTLREGGYIQSENYDPESPEESGFCIGYNGDADFNGDTHIAGKVAIGVPLRDNPDLSDYDVVLGGNTKICGITEINDTTTINGTTEINGTVHIQGDASYKGKIESNGGIFLKNRFRLVKGLSAAEIYTYITDTLADSIAPNQFVIGRFSCTVVDSLLHMNRVIATENIYSINYTKDNSLIIQGIFQDDTMDVVKAGYLTITLTNNKATFRFNFGTQYWTSFQNYVLDFYF